MKIEIFREDIKINLSSSERKISRDKITKMLGKHRIHFN